MATFPEILSPDPSVKPAESEKTYPHAWVTNLIVTAPSPDRPIQVGVTMRNYNRDTQELSPLPQDYTRLAISDLSAEADRCVLVAQTVGMLLTCVNLLAQERTLQQKLAEANQSLDEAQAMPEGDDRDAAVAAAQAAVDSLIAGLSTVRQGLGVVAT